MADTPDITERLQARSQELGSFAGILPTCAMAQEATDDAVAMQEAAAEILRLRSELEAARKDAGRYRWLRECNWYESALCVLRDPKRVLTSRIGLGADCPSLNRLDAAIDSEIAKGA